VIFPGHAEADPGSPKGMTYYRRQLEFLNRELLRSVDAILSAAASPPVIVIQSDEGFQANPEPLGEATMQTIRVKGLAAFYLPGVPHPGVPDPPTSVNDLRYVFNQYLGTHYDLLPSASYPEGDLPYEFKEMPVP
jgi:hypothetical protein